jgi:potassium/hydrogen antiporter
MELLSTISLPLLGVAALIFFAVLAGIFSSRIGFPFLLIFLLAGGLAGEDGLGIQFEDFVLSFWVGNVALAIILVDGGLRTQLAAFRTGFKPALTLATLGVVVTAGLTGLAAMWFLSLPWSMALLLGAIVASTDAAAVFSVLKSSGSRLNERVEATLELESGMNDPMAVYLTILFIGISQAVMGKAPAMEWQWIVVTFFQQFLLGALVGVGVGFGVAWLLPLTRTMLDNDSGILALLLVSAGIGVFALANWFGGSGFLAAYIYAVVVGNRARRTVRRALSAMDGLAWLAQAVMFLLLGLLVSPSEVMEVAPEAIAVAMFMMLIARPLAVALCLFPLRFRPAETFFISWVGLRGAVPIILAIFPVVAGLSGARIFFDVAFVVVVTSLLFQASTMRWLAKRLGMVLPKATASDYSDVFGLFVLDARIPMSQLCKFYDLLEDVDSKITVSAWCKQKLKRPPIPGDKVSVGDAELAVREIENGEITKVGLKLGG